MTDEKLDQILKQALAPEVYDTEIMVHKRRKGKMRKFDKIRKRYCGSSGSRHYWYWWVGVF